MRCQKCNGWMCTEGLSDFHSEFDLWRCVNCGARMDRTILENRKSLPRPSPTKDSVPVDEEVDEEVGASFFD